MNDEYILDGHEPVLSNDLIAYAKWFKAADRHVGKTQISDDIEISTVFLGLNHNYGAGIPILFETMVFGGILDGELERYATWEEAEEGHKRWVEKVRINEREGKPNEY